MLDNGTLGYTKLVEPRLSKAVLDKIRQSRRLGTNLRGEKMLG